MNILVFDDDITRHDWFDEYFDDENIWHAYDVKQFKRALKNVNFDRIYLDHDISKKETGMDAIRCIILYNISCDHIIVHSWNPVGAKNMVTVLNRAGYHVTRAPFPPIVI